jgi:hypothetical protein
VELKGQAWEDELQNTNSSPAAFRIEVQNKPNSKLVIIPGTIKSTDKSGSGDLLSFATALSGYYGIPIILEAKPSSKTFAWTFNPNSAFGAVSETLAPEYSGEVRTGGILVIQ